VINDEHSLPCRVLLWTIAKFDDVIRLGEIYVKTLCIFRPSPAMAVLVHHACAPRGELMKPTISYANNAEDIVLIRLFDDQGSGRYIDVGASFPELGSVTKIFYGNGWGGVILSAPRPSLTS
jgi:hypothetical protein